MYLNNNLKYLRKMNNMKQEDVAEALGYKSYTTISKWEDGVSTPNIESLVKLSDMYDVSIDSMINTNLSENPDILNKWKKFLNNEDMFAMLVKLHDIARTMDREQIKNVLAYAINISND